MTSKIKVTITASRILEVDYDNFVIHDEGVPPRKLSKEEAIKFDEEAIKEDPFDFIDSKDTELAVKIEDIE